MTARRECERSSPSAYLPVSPSFRCPPTESVAAFLGCRKTNQMSEHVAGRCILVKRYVCTASIWMHDPYLTRIKVSSVSSSQLKSHSVHHQLPTHPNPTRSHHALLHIRSISRTLSSPNPFPCPSYCTPDRPHPNRRRSRFRHRFFLRWVSLDLLSHPLNRL
jgi:hypothetical protein